MKRLLILTLTVILTAALLANVALARVPRTMNVQGVLMDDSGVVLDDGDYTVFFQLWDLQTDGSDLWGETNVVTQSDGYFNVILGHFEDFPPDLFTHTLWLSLQVEGDSPMEPRIEMTSVASALSAGHLDRGAAVLSLNGLQNNVNLQAGTNVTITQQDSTLTINAAGGAGGSDTDWVIDGEDITHQTGRVIVGVDNTGYSVIPPNKMMVNGTNGGLVAYMYENNADEDGRSAILALRNSGWGNAGSSFQLENSNAAIMAYNRTVQDYTFGISGYSGYGINKRNYGAVMGKLYHQNYWASLAFVDSNMTEWGMYTPGDIHVGGMTQTNTFRMTAGAQDGYLLSTDASGNATWSPPASVQNDGDWTVTGNSVYRSGYGTVALGTNSPHNWNDSTSATTLQIKAMFSPTLALDAQGLYPNNDLHRWTMTGGSGGIQFNKSDVYNSYGTTALRLTETGTEFYDHNGDKMAQMVTYNGLDLGGELLLFGTYSNVATVSLDGQASGGGGQLTLRDNNDQVEVEITGNYSNSGVGRITTPVLEITGGSDLSEQFDIGNTSALTEPGMVVSIDPENPGQLTLSGEAYDRRVAGVISGAGGVNTGMVMGQRGTVADGELPVALVGRVYVWADANGGPIEPGDLLTTSDRPGHAMKVTDHTLATGAILGKAMTGLSEGQGLVLTLVTLQ